MREACLYNNWSFVPIFLKIYRALMRWTPWSFFGEVAVMSRHDGGTHLEWGVEGRGMRALSQILSDENLSYSLKHISTGKHSLHISWRSTHLLHLYFLFSWWRHQMETCSASLAFVRGIHRRLRGIHRRLRGINRSPVTSPHTDQWRGALMFSLICAWTDSWVNNQDAGDLRRHRAHYDVTVIWCRIVIQWSRQPWDLSAFNASLLSNFELVKRVKLGVPCIMEKIASNLAHCSTLITIPWN